ncbi:ATP-binding protein [Paenibacillus sp. JDR-2]|uniref:ATP-binding protein n=1 Tax=Paenibacillus sp. (strain JDR-2) TaxID=324057 RepID=UPI000166A35C|nr:ATP-binding protein [Paenibacillus sp. JDR-2]ACT00517.1 putative anti-sigma regulatory factor, serine/threonine protein kinase [Paenibacillus sp. JDR-2]
MIRLQIPSHADYIDIVRVCLYGIASKLNFSYEDIEDMKVAVSEACTNAVLHGGSEREEGSLIDITFQPSEAGITIIVKNDGPPFEHSETGTDSPPLQGIEISELPVGGLGIYLMEALMDEVSVQSTDSSTEVILTKYVSE